MKYVYICVCALYTEPYFKPKIKHIVHSRIDAGNHGQLSITYDSVLLDLFDILNAYMKI